MVSDMRQKIQNSPFLFDENDRIVCFKQPDGEFLFRTLEKKTPVNAVARQGDPGRCGCGGSCGW